MADDAARQVAQRLVDTLEDIPPMPAVATKVLQVASSEFAQVAEVTRLIASDQGLASKVLGTCNSAYYGLPHQVKTLSRAVALLGFRAVRNLVLVHSLPWKRAGAPSFSEKTIWAHSTGAAVASRVIGGLTGVVDAEESLLAGLMHDTGRLALNLLKPADYEPVMHAIYNREGGSIEIEREKLGVDHAMAGEFVLRKWGFPQELVDVAARHHDPPGELAPLVLVSRGADEIVRLMGLGVKEPDAPPAEAPPGLTLLGFALSDLGDLEERISAAFEQSQNIFGGA